MINRLFIYIGWTSISLMMFLLLYFIYLIFYPFKTLDVVVPMKVITKQVVAGHDLIYQADYCKYDTAGAKVSRTLVGPVYIPTPVVETVTVQGCRVVKIHLKVPEDAPGGTYHLEVLAEIKVNIFKTINRHFYSEDFVVIH